MRHLPEENVMSVSSVTASSSAFSPRAVAPQSAPNTRSAEERQESAAERQQEVSSGEESGSAVVQQAQKNLGATVNLLT
jgi:hypothetical protein